MTTFVRNAEVARPVPDPLTSSVLDHATVVDLPNGFGLRSDEGLWPSYNCLDLMVPTPICPDPTVEKEFGVAPWVPAFAFAVHGGVQCALHGLDRADQAAEVRRVFALSEGKGVERALLANRFVANDGTDVTSMTGQTIEWDAPVDLTPAGKTISIKVALALLEGYAAAHYAGVPTIHAPRAAVSLMSDMIVWRGDKAYTPAGSKVAVGGGYDETGEVPDDGKWDLYATGEVYVERSEQVDVTTHELNGGNGSPFDPNTGVAFAERMYRVGVDCFVAKATGTIWS